jgi:hypothetical protein
MGPMLKVSISKRQIAELVDRVRRGEALEPEAEGWRLADMLTVAGVLLSTAVSASGQTRPRQPGHRDAAQKLLQDMQGAIEFIGAMANALGSGTFDDYFDQRVTIGIGADTVTPIEGFKR